jgi:protein-disulfide isomerase
MNGMGDLTSAPLPPLSDAEHIRGPAEAPLVILYADFTCPRCALAHERLCGLPLRVAYRHFALQTKHPRAVPLACAAEAAGQQGRFWGFCDALFADPGRCDDPHLWGHAERLGLDVERFDSERRSAGVAAAVQAQVRAGLRAGIAVTPTLVFDGTLHPGPPDANLLLRLTRTS